MVTHKRLATNDLATSHPINRTRIVIFGILHMGGLFISTDPVQSRRRALAERARPHFARAGLSRPMTLEMGGILIDLYPKHGRVEPTILHLENGDFALAVGTLIFKGTTGAEALRRILADPGMTFDNIRGAYLLLVHRAGRTTLRADQHGTYELYVDSSRTLFSTALLALAACLPRRSARRAECLEYIIGGVTLGTATPINEIDRLDLGEIIDFRDTKTRHVMRPRMIEQEQHAPVEELVERSLSALRAVMDDYATAFENRVRISFSGGYDSRLLFALARDRGVNPQLFVYGFADAPDVRYAAALAHAEDAVFAHIDKTQIRQVTFETFPDMVRASTEMNDGFSQYWMFCSDSENYARIDRCAGDGVIMNGGGGEVFRNFFKFSGQSMSVRAFVRAFFSSYDPAILRDPSLRVEYEANLESKIVGLFDLDRSGLTRAHVQSLYPHLRCRSWFGRDTSLDNRFGYRATPYLEPVVVSAGLQVPLRWKNFGVFQGRLIKALSPSIAAKMSSHGYGFDRDPPWRARLGDVRLFAEPLALRAYNFRINQLINGTVERPRELSPKFVESVIDRSFPRTAALFNPEKLSDPTQYQRLSVLEYVFDKVLS